MDDYHALFKSMLVVFTKIDDDWDSESMKEFLGEIEVDFDEQETAFFNMLKHPETKIVFFRNVKDEKQSL